MEAWFNHLLRPIPDRIGIPLRTRWLRKHAGHFGEGSVVTRGCRVLKSSGLTIGNGVTVARDVTLDARGGLTLEDGALIGFESVLLTHTHKSTDIGVRIQDQGFESAPIRIGERVWLGTRVIVLPGVTIGADSIVGAGAVVTKNLPPRSIAAGTPAHKLRTR